MTRPKPRDMKLYDKVKKEIYKKYKKHSAYRSGHLVREYKKQYAEKYGEKSDPYIGNKTKKRGLKRWFDEKWVNQRGKVGYKYDNDIYRPSIRITDETPITHGELSNKEIDRARNEKYRKGRVHRFKKTKKSAFRFSLSKDRKKDAEKTSKNRICSTLFLKIFRCAAQRTSFWLAIDLLYRIL